MPSSLKIVKNLILENNSVAFFLFNVLHEFCNKDHLTLNRNFIDSLFVIS